MKPINQAKKPFSIDDFNGLAKEMKAHIDRLAQSYTQDRLGITCPEHAGIVRKIDEVVKDTKTWMKQLAKRSSQ